jgi:hypothetical protein
MELVEKAPAECCHLSFLTDLCLLMILFYTPLQLRLLPIAYLTLSVSITGKITRLKCGKDVSQVKFLLISLLNSKA